MADTLKHLPLKQDLEEGAKWIVMHKAEAGLVGALAAGVGLFLYHKSHSSSNALSNIGSSFSTPVDTGSTDTSGLTTGTIAPTSPADAGYSQTDLTNAAQQGYSAGLNYDPAKGLDSLANSAASQSAQTTSANCNSIKNCGGHNGHACGPFSFLCAPIMNIGDCVLGGVVRIGSCVGSAAITVGTGLSATLLPSIQTASQAVASQAGAILTGKLGIPSTLGIPKPVIGAGSAYTTNAAVPVPIKPTTPTSQPGGDILV